MPDLGQYASAPMASLPLIVFRLIQMLCVMASLMNFTEPSPNRVLTPPGCRLREAGESVVVASRTRAGKLSNRFTHAEDRLVQEVAAVDQTQVVLQLVGREAGHERTAAGHTRPHQPAHVIAVALKHFGHEDRVARAIPDFRDLHVHLVSEGRLHVDLRPDRVLPPVRISPAHRVVALWSARYY